MFNGSGNGNNDSKCAVCGATGELNVVVLNKNGLKHRALRNIKCDNCDGKGYFETAATAAAKWEQQRK